MNWNNFFTIKKKYFIDNIYVNQYYLIIIHKNYNRLNLQIKSTEKYISTKNLRKLKNNKTFKIFIFKQKQFVYSQYQSINPKSINFQIHSIYIHKYTCIYNLDVYTHTYTYIHVPIYTQ